MRPSYNGGKGGPGVYQTIINQMPPHRVYIECYLGAGSVLRHKRPALCNIGVESDASVLARWWRGDEVPALELVNASALPYLASYTWRGDELVYLDPPYMFATRRYNATPYYQHELTDTDHCELLALIKTLPVPVLISGYHSELYSRELADWRALSFSAGTRNGPAVEWLWCNFPEPTALHDYQYLGKNYREREKFVRRQRRWRARLARMGPLERQALLSAIQAAGL